MKQIKYLVQPLFMWIRFFATALPIVKPYSTKATLVETRCITSLQPYYLIYFLNKVIRLCYVRYHLATKVCLTKIRFCNGLDSGTKHHFYTKNGITFTIYY
jgi:hypothetical protein